MRGGRLAQAAIVVVALALLWSAAWFYAPPLIRSQLQQGATAQLGRPVSVESVIFKPWTLELDLAGLAVAGADGASPPQLRVDRIHVDVALQSLFRLGPVVDRLDIEGPHLRLARLGDGRFDVDDILQRLAAKPPSDEPAKFAVHKHRRLAQQHRLRRSPGSSEARLAELELAIPVRELAAGAREVKVERGWRSCSTAAASTRSPRRRRSTSAAQASRRWR